MSSYLSEFIHKTEGVGWSGETQPSSAWKVTLQSSLNGMVDHVVEKAMAPQSSTIAWKIPWTEEPGGLQSMGSLRVRHD